MKYAFEMRCWADLPPAIIWGHPFLAQTQISPLAVFGFPPSCLPRRRRRELMRRLESTASKGRYRPL